MHSHFFLGGIIMAEVNARKRGNKWQFYFEGAKVNGKRQRIVKSGFNTKKEALAAGVEALAQYNNCGVAVLSSDISVQDFAQEFIDYCSRRLKWSTYESYKGVLNANLIKELGRYKLCDLNFNVAEELAVSMKNKGLSYSTIRKNINVIRRMYDYAIKREVVKVNPFKDVAVPENIENRGNPNFSYSDTQIATFYDTYKEDILGTVLMLGYHCGLRLSESLGLTWNDVDFENKVIRINKQLVLKEGIFYFTTPKYNSNRTISIDDTLVNYLKELKSQKENYTPQKRYKINLDKSISEGDDISFVVSKLDSTMVSNKYIHQRIDIFKHEGYPSFRTHELRHTHCTKLISSGVNPKYVQARLGHKSIQTTMNIYHHLTDEMESAEFDKLNALF